MKTDASYLRRILAANIKKQRKILGLTQEKLAEMAEVSWQTINSIECNRTWVSDKTLERLTNALKIDGFQLLMPISTDQPKTLSSDEAIRNLLKIKRSFDDKFNEIINSVR